MIDAKEAAIFQAAVCIKNNDFLSAENIISNNYNIMKNKTRIFMLKFEYFHKFCRWFKKTLDPHIYNVYNV